MLSRHLKKILFLLVLALQGCQYFVSPTPLVQEKPNDQEQIYDLLSQGMHYQKLKPQQQQKKCEQLKLAYQAEPRWQSAWLMINALNHNYRCLSQIETIELLTTLQKNTANVISQLLWLNNNQIQLHKQVLKLKNLQTKLSNTQKKNRNLLIKLNTAKKQLLQVNTKIQALKTIETNINKKLDEQAPNGK